MRKTHAILNTFTDYNFQDAFKKIREALGTMHTLRRGLLRELWWPVGSKLIFDEIEAVVSEIMDGSLQFHKSILYPALRIYTEHRYHQLGRSVVENKTFYLK
jgi:hypothetical protein